MLLFWLFDGISDDMGCLEHSELNQSVIAVWIPSPFPTQRSNAAETGKKARSDGLCPTSEVLFENM